MVTRNGPSRDVEMAVQILMTDSLYVFSDSPDYIGTYKYPSIGLVNSII